jgi:hypothetical protein
MGKLILHEWASLLAISSGLYAGWAGIWGIFFRKFFWDMIGGTLGPHGIIPPKSESFFIMIIVTLPIVQILNIFNGLATIALEYPAPLIEGTSIHRSLTFRAVFYFWCAFIAALPYQSVDSALYYLITSIVFAIAQYQGEVMKVAAANKGKSGMA